MERTSGRAIAALAVISLFTAIAAIVVATTSGGSDDTAPTANRTISVTGKGVVQGVPDTLVASLRIHEHEASVQAALDAVAGDGHQVIATLRGHAVKAGDIQTANLSLNPSYDNHGNIDGYDAGETLSVRIHPLTHVGAVLSAAATSAGNAVSINGLSLDVTDDAALIDSARAKALANAKSAAQRDASLAGASLGEVVRIKETRSHPTPVPRPFYGADALATNAKALAIRPGKQPVTVRVAVIWALD